MNTSLVTQIDSLCDWVNLCFIHSWLQSVCVLSSVLSMAVRKAVPICRNRQRMGQESHKGSNNSTWSNLDMELFLWIVHQSTHWICIVIVIAQWTFFNRWEQYRFQEINLNIIFLFTPTLNHLLTLQGLCYREHLSSANTQSAVCQHFLWCWHTLLCAS